MSVEEVEKFCTRLRGFRISWATPAVSSPSSASFWRLTSWSWVFLSSTRSSSSSSFLNLRSSESSLHEVQLLGADRLAAQDLQVVRDLGDFVLACGPDGIAQVAGSQAPDPEL